MTHGCAPRTRSLSNAIALFAMVSALFSVRLAAAQVDSIVGSGTAGFSTFDVNAQSGPNGEDPTGTVSVNTAIGLFEGNVTKLCVSGNEGVIVGLLVGGPYAGSGFAVHVRDNAQNVGLRDLMRLEILGYVPTACVPFAMISPTAVTSGDIVVSDDRPQAPAYACNGFFAPANEDVALGAKVERTIPLKMELLNDGVPVTNSTLAGIEPVVNVTFQSTLGPAADGTALLPSVSKCKQGNKFRYDVTTGQWILNFCTPDYESAGTYTVTTESGNSDTYGISPTCKVKFIRSN